MSESNGQAGSPDRSEGDLNVSPLRDDFVRQHLDDRARHLLNEDARYFFRQSLSTPCLNALTGAEGSHLIDCAGRRILDFHGNNVHQVGHAHPAVVAAVAEQLQRLAFCPRRYTNEKAVELARRLSELAPVSKAGGPAKVLLAPGGALAVDTALKIARYATGRYKTVSMHGSFHGASLGAISIGGEELFRRGIGPLLPGCFHVPPCGPEGDGRDSADRIEDVLAREGDIAAVVAEPMRWTTVIPPPPDYWPRVRESCDRHGTLLVLDEIPACLGRTGRMFCIEHFGIQPDVMVLGKGLGGGVFPLAAVAARGGLDIAPQASLGHYTHEKSPLGAAAALATLDVIEQDGLLERAGRLGSETLKKLREGLGPTDLVHDVRGLGLQMGVEVRAGGEKACEQAERMMYACLERGLSFKVSDGNVLTLSPPLTISNEEMAQALTILTEVIMTA